MPGIRFDITGDNQHFINAMNGVQNQVRQTSAVIESSGSSIEAMFNRIAGAAGLAFSAASMNSFIDKVRETRAYFQDIESTMEVFLGSQEKAATFTKQLKDYAYYNMFEFSELAMASKQMIAYHTAVEDVIPELDKLSNIATGTKQPLMELVSMYNNARNVGYIASQQLGMWARQGILVKDTLKELGQEVKKGGVTFEQLQMVIDHYTGEGGMFHNLMANQMENISAEQGQLADTLDLMYDEIGRRYQDVIVKGYKAASEAAEGFPAMAQPIMDMAASGAEFLIDHYKEIGTILIRLIATYGAYKAALVATNAAEQSMNNLKYKEEVKALQEQLTILQNLKGKKEEIISQDLLEYTAAGKLTEERAKQLELERERLAIRVDKGELTVEQANDISDMQTKVALLDQEHQINLKTADDKIKALKEEKEYYDGLIALGKQDVDEKNKALQVAKDKLQSAEDLVKATQARLAEENKIAAITGQEVDSRVKDNAADAIEAYQQLSESIDIETLAEKANQAQEELNIITSEADIVTTNLQTATEQRHSMVTTADTVAIEGNTLATRLHSAATKAGAQVMLIFNAAVGQVKNAFIGLKAAIMTNPLGVLIGALTIVLPLLMDFFGSEEDAVEQTKRFGESADKATNKVKSLYAVLDSTNSGSKANNDALSELIRTYNEYGIKLDETIMKEGTESDKLKEVIKHRNELIDVIKQEAIERQAANDISSASETYESNIEQVKKDIKEEIGGGWSDEAKNQIVDNFITDEYIEELTKAANKYKAVMDELRKKGQSIYGRVGREALAEYKSAVGAVNDKIDSMAKSTNELSGKTVVSKKDIEKAKKAIQDHAVELVKHRNELDNSIDSANIARDAALKASGAIDENTTKLRMNKSSLAEIKSFLEDIARRNKIDIDINVRYNEENPMPEALKKLTSEQWKKRAAAYAAIANDMKHDKIAVKDVWTGQTTTLTKQQVAEEAARSANEGESKRKQEEADKRAKEKEKEEAEKNKKKYAQQAKEQAARLSKQLQLDQKEREEREEQAQRTADAVAEAKIAAEQNAAVRERMEQDRQHELNLRQIDDQAEEYRKRNYEAMKARWEAQNKDKTKTWETSGAGRALAKDVAANGYKNIALTDAQEQEITELTKIREAERARIVLDRQKAELQALRDYIKEYGTIQEQKLAIAEEYAEKIAEAEEAGNYIEAENLRNQQEKEVSQKKMEQLKGEIDWEGLFNNLDAYTVDFLKTIREKLQASLQDPNIEATDKQVIAEKISDIDELVVTKSETTFKWINNYLEEQRRLQAEAKVSADAAAQAQMELNAAQGEAGLERRRIADFINGIKGEGYAEKTFGNNLEGLKGDSETYKKILADMKWDENAEGAKKLKDALDKLAATDARVSAKTNEASKARAKALRDEAKKEKDPTKKFAKTLEAFAEDVSREGEKISHIASTLGLGDFAGKVDSGISGINSAADAATAFATRDYLGAAMNGLDALSSFSDALGLDMNGFLFGRESDETYAEDMERLTQSNENLMAAVDRLSKVMEDSSFGEIEETYKKQQRSLEVIKRNDKEALVRGLVNRNEGGVFSSGDYTSAHKILESLSESDKKLMTDLTGVEFRKYFSISRMRENTNSDFAKAFSSLSPEEMAKLREEPELWNKIVQSAAKGHTDVSKTLEEYADLGEKMSEVTRQYYESVTKISFDELKDGFADALMSMEKDATDTAENISKIMANALIQDMVNKNYKEPLEKWQQDLGKALEADDKDWLENLREQYQKMMDEAALKAQQIKDYTGYTDAVNKASQQSATANSIQNISYDQADSLVGITTAMQIAQEQGNMQREMTNSILQNIQLMQTGFAGTFDEIRTLTLQANSTRETMLKIMKERYESFDTKLTDIYRELQAHG